MKVLVTGGAGFIGSNFLHYEVETYPNDTLTFIGKGAGSLQTDSAVVLDIVDIIEGRCLNNYKNIKKFKIN